MCRAIILVVLGYCLSGCTSTGQQDQQETNPSLTTVAMYLDSLLTVDRDSIQHQMTRLQASSPQLARVLALYFEAYRQIQRCETLCQPIGIPIPDEVPIDATVCKNSMSSRLRDCNREARDPDAYGACVGAALGEGLCPRDDTTRVVQ